MSQAKNRVTHEIGQTRTRTRMVHTARRVLPDEEAEDAAHDAVVQALLSAESFRADAQVGTWLYRIAFNAALMKQRSARRRKQRMSRLQVELDAASASEDNGPSIAGLLETAQARTRLRSAVARLPECYRKVIERCVYAEESPETVAADLGLSPSALRTRFTRARGQLKRLVAEADPLRDAQNHPAPSS